MDYVYINLHQFIIKYFIQRFDSLRIEFEAIDDCFELLKNTVENTPAEPFFLSILQHLIFIRDDINVR